MTQADSVHSTPPTNTSAIGDTQSPAKPRSRRSVLATIAGATAAITVANARPAGAAMDIDPIYAAIATHAAMPDAASRATIPFTRASSPP